MLSAPEDYGLTPEQTLAHRVQSAPPADFDAFWAEFREEIAATPCTWRGRVDDEINYLEIPSIRAVRVMARLTMPDPRSRGLVIALHGAEVPDIFPLAPEPWSGLGLATLRLHVRGYPPSTLDIDDLREHWIEHRLGLADGWIVRGAVADVVQAYRCARRHFGPAMPLSLYGESLGGGLAVMAAGQLTALDDAPHRLVMALPSLGDWHWRAERYCRGMGDAVNAALRALREDAPPLLDVLSLYDAAHHAAAVEVPTLAKLAVRDDVVPAPSAAAVFNALHTTRKWRFLTPCGHHDGGLANARRHALFERIHPRWIDPATEPEDAIKPQLGQLDP